MTSRRASLAAAWTILACCGCQAHSSPPPTSGYTCIAEPGGIRFECTQNQHDRMLAQDRLVTEARRVYEKFLTEDVRIMRAGGTDNPTPALLETTTGDFLADLMSHYRELKRTRTRFVGGEVRLASLQVAAGVVKGGSVVALRACLDARTVQIHSGAKAISKGLVGVDLLYFGRFGNHLKIQGADGKETRTCPD